MQYEFSVGAFVFGIMIVVAGVLVVRFHAWLADNFSGGAMSYERFKLSGVIACVVGLLVMVNLHTLILGALVRAIFPSI